MSASSSLAITFTRKAADELRHRVEVCIGWKHAAGITVCNFHQLALKILRQHYSILGFKQQFSVLGAEEQRDLVRTCIIRWQEAESSRGTPESRMRVLQQYAVNQAELQEADDLMNDSLGPGGFGGDGDGPRFIRSGIVMFRVSSLELHLTTQFYLARRFQGL